VALPGRNCLCIDSGLLRTYIFIDKVTGPICAVRKSSRQQKRNAKILRGAQNDNEKQTTARLEQATAEADSSLSTTLRVRNDKQKGQATAKQEQATAKAKAGPSTPLLAKWASNFAQDDTFIGGSR
jgi:hypothetical protein